MRGSIIPIFSDAINLRVKRWFGLTPKPIGMGLMVTYACDSRCTYCNIWKNYIEKPELYEQELSSDQMCKLLLDNKEFLKNLRRVYISGGEPFLKNDFEAILRCIHSISPKVSLGIATNGLQPERIARTVKNVVEDVPINAISVSLDGMRDTNDALRGVGGFDRAIKTIEKLSKLGDKYEFSVGIGFTIGPENYKELIDVYKLSKRMNASFICRSVHISHYYSNTDQSYQFGDDAIEGITNMLRKIANDRGPVFSSRWLTSKLERKLFSFYLNGIETYIKDPSHMIVPCFFGTIGFMLDPYGCVFPCSIIEDPIGNIKESTLAEIWSSEEAKATRKKIEKGMCPNCWMDCMIDNIMLDLVQVFKWSIGSSLREPT